MVKLTRSNRWQSVHTGRLVSAYLAGVLTRPLPPVPHPGVAHAALTHLWAPYKGKHAAPMTIVPTLDAGAAADAWGL